MYTFQMRPVVVACISWNCVSTAFGLWLVAMMLHCEAAYIFCEPRHALVVALTGVHAHLMTYLLCGRKSSKQLVHYHQQRLVSEQVC